MVQVPARMTLRGLRDARGLSLRRAGEAIGVTARTLQDYEKGRCMPKVHTALRMAELYGVPVEYIPVLIRRAAAKREKAQVQG